MWVHLISDVKEPKPENSQYENSSNKVGELYKASTFQMIVWYNIFTFVKSICCSRLAHFVLTVQGAMLARPPITYNKCQQCQNYRAIKTLLNLDLQNDRHNGTDVLHVSQSQALVCLSMMKRVRLLSQRICHFKDPNKGVF